MLQSDGISPDKEGFYECTDSLQFILVDHEAYCSEQSIVYYRFNVQKFVDFCLIRLDQRPI